ncbi:hypothetical protein PsorP6_007533 [Peronosclerospora sorghi]|uniref:Uncharacterized protein n=1 Tax=Peronosclerospora sorghi TaxID=230839 RepID=A0ACC0W8M4_9STRA|nr:hypothetical protein PsorP6_007533 [Peronosclerospora sorghi]
MRPIEEILYTIFFALDEDIHHILPVGKLEFIHRKKEDDNARIGFTVGYAEDVVGVQCMILPIGQSSVCQNLIEDMMYENRHKVDPDDENIGELLLFHSEDPGPEGDSTLEDGPYEDGHTNQDDTDVSMYERSQGMSMTTDDDSSEVNPNLTHESV